MTTEPTEVHNPHNKPITGMEEILKKNKILSEPAPPPSDPPADPPADPAPATVEADPELQKQLEVLKPPAPKEPDPAPAPAQADEYRLVSKDERDVEAFSNQRLRIKELESQVKRPANQEEFESLKQQVEKQKSVIRELDLSRDPDFQAKYDEPIRANLAKAKRLLPEDVDLQEFANSLSMPVQERSQFLGDKYPHVSGTLINISLDIEEIRDAKNDALKNADQHFETLSQEKTDMSQSKLQQHVGTIRSKAIIFQPMPGDEEWNKDYVEAFNSDLAMDNRPIEEMKAQAALAPAYQKMIFDLLGKISQLNNEMGNYINLDPNLTDSRTTLDKPPPGSDPNKVKDLKQITKTAISKIGR